MRLSASLSPDDPADAFARSAVIMNHPKYIRSSERGLRAYPSWYALGDAANLSEPLTQQFGFVGGRS